MVKRHLMAILKVGDKTKYVDEMGNQVVSGEVTLVKFWKDGKPEKGGTIYVRHSYGGVGQFRSDHDHDCLYRADEIIPESVLQRHLTEEAVHAYHQSECDRLEQVISAWGAERALLEEDNARLRAAGAGSARPPAEAE